MAPKKELPAVTPATVAAGLAAAEPAQKHAALTQLAAASFNNPQALADVVQQGIPGTLVELLQHSSDKSVKLLACRQLAVYAAAGPGHSLQQAVASVQTTQVLWCVLQSYAESKAAIKAVLADPAALRAAAAPKKLPGAKEPADPDEGLPGPSNFLLEAALRALSSLAACSTAAAEPAVGTSTSSGPEQPQQQQQPRTCLLAQEALPVVCLLQHTSSRVQMWALRLALQLARSEPWCARFTAAGGVASAAHLAGVLGGGSDISTGNAAAAAAVQLSALQLLVRLVKVSHTAAAAVLASRRQALDGLMATMLAAGSLRPTTPAAGGAKVKVAAGADAAKQGAAVRDTAVLVQQAAADLLALLCATDSQTCQLLLGGDGLTALTSMMPDPPPAAGCVAASEPESAPPQQPQQQADNGTSNSALCPAAQVNGRAGGARAAAAVPALSLTTDADADSGGGGVRPQSPHRQKGGTPRSRHATPAGGQTADAPPPTAAVVAAATTSFTAPGTKLSNPQLQAKLLHIIAAVLSVPDGVKPVLNACPALPRLLLHMFAAPPGPAADDPAFAAVAGAGSGTGAAVPADAAAAAKGAPGTAAVGAAAAKSGAQTPRGSVAVGVKVAVAAPGVQGSSSGAATPRKTLAAGAASKAPEPAANDPLGAPYATCTKLAALACLRHLAHHKPAAALLASQHTAAAASPALAADSPPATVRQRAREPQQQQEDRSGCSMLRQVLVCIQALGTDSSTAAEQIGDAAGSSSSSDRSSAAAAETDARQQQPPPPVTAILDDAASFIEGLVAHLEEQLLLELPLVPTLQVLAKCASQHAAAHHLQEAVMRALLSLPEDAFAAPPRPPLPSPPPPPPPPPLPTSLFAWDALDRPCVTDGEMVISTHA